MPSKIATPKLVEQFKGIVDIKTLTNSARNEFLNCRKKFYYSYMCGLSPRTLQVPFLVGGLFHDELERMYTDKKWDLESADKRITKAIHVAIVESDILDDREAQGLWQQRAILKGILKGYKAKYKKDKTWKIRSAEEKFRIELKNGWKYAGMIDMLIFKGQQLFIVEHKTTSRLDQGYVGRLPLDNQIIGYSWAVFKLLKKMPKGVIYNVVKKTQLRQGGAEKFENYLKRVTEDYVLNPTKYYYRETLLFTKKDLQSFQIELYKLIEEIERCEDTGFYYRNPTACTMYGKCLFMPLCTMGMNDNSLMQYSIRDSVHAELEEEKPKGKEKKSGTTKKKSPRGG